MKRYKYRKTFTFEGKRYNAYGNTEREALTRMIQKKADLESGKVTLSGAMLVRDWAEIAFTTYKPNVTDKYRAEIQQRVRKHIIPAIGSMQLKAVKPVDCQKIMNTINGSSKSLIQKVSEEIHFLFKTAKQNHLIYDNPADYMIVPKAAKPKRNSLSRLEIDAFKKACSDTERFRVFELMFYCGCRSAEAMKCSGNDISCDKDVAMLHIRGTKSVNADRFVPIPKDFYAKIKDTDAESPIAPNFRGDFHTKTSYVSCSRSLVRAMNLALGCKTYHGNPVPPFPLRESFVPYELRHTYCTNLARKGVDIRIAQKLMGHSSISITADIYTHVSQEQMM